MFDPRLRDRTSLERTHGIAAHTRVLLFVGRLDDCKSCMTAALAARRLLEHGRDIHFIFVGEGARRAEIAELLGDAASLPGILPQAELATLYASSDLFVFPSRTETFGNVVLEARASGLPVVVSARGGAGERVRQNGLDGLRVSSDTPEAWADAITALIDDAAARERIRQAALADAARMPGWRDVLEQDLLPVWRALGDAPAVHPRRIAAAQ